MQRRSVIRLGPVETDLRAAVLALAFLAGLLALAVVVAADIPAFDLPVLRQFERLRDTALWPVLNGLNLVGYPAVWDTAVVAIALVLAVQLRRRNPILLPVGLFLAEALTVGAKLVLDRSRPSGVIIQDLVTPASFPSGHVVRVVVTVWLALLFAWPWLQRRGLALPAAVGAIALSALIGTARMAAGEHWPSDVLGAYLLSGAFVSAVAAVSSRGSSS